MESELQDEPFHLMMELISIFWIIKHVLMVQRLAHQVEDREVPGSSPTQD